jgi:hypothetical protein
VSPVSARSRLAFAAFVILAGCATEASSNPIRGQQGFAPVTLPDAAFSPVTEPPATSGRDPLAGLMVGPERSAGTYDRSLFEHWIDADGNGCDTRCEVLKRDRRSDLPGLREGWRSIYDGYTTDDASELEVDHVVALAEAWRSGADAWTPTRRRDFANDLTPGALRAVTAASNSAKSDKDPAGWQPSSRDAWCEWAQGYVRTKIRWRLSADRAEAQALRNILAAC